jgi:hypothetical protein
MSSANKNKFLQFIGNFNANLDIQIKADNEEVNLNRFFKKQILQPDLNKDDESFINNATNTAIEKIKHLNNDNIFEILSLYLDNLYGDNKNKFNNMQRQNYGKIAKEIHHEINKRGLKSRMHALIAPNIEMLLHYIEKIK